MRKEFINSGRRSRWNGNEWIFLTEERWEIYIQRMQQEEREGQVRLVELPCGTREEERRVAVL